MFSSSGSSLRVSSLLTVSDETEEDILSVGPGFPPKVGILVGILKVDTGDDDLLRIGVTGRGALPNAGMLKDTFEVAVEEEDSFPPGVCGRLPTDPGSLISSFEVAEEEEAS